MPSRTAGSSATITLHSHCPLGLRRTRRSRPDRRRLGWRTLSVADDVRLACYWRNAPGDQRCVPSDRAEGACFMSSFKTSP
jgi:hypothetical protein